MADKLGFYELNHQVNPFGVIFHPIALAQLYHRVLENHFFDAEDIFEHNGLWQSFWVHSSMSETDPQRLVDNLNKSLNELRDAMTSASHLVFTFGSAWGYTHLATDRLVANCHKVPAYNFNRQLSSGNQITAAWLPLITGIRAVNPNVEMIFTVSPVRHIKDGLIQNNQSKANLLLAAHHLVEHHDMAHYFPAYEIMIDELRDYRYYDKDLIHPSETAIDYIWEKFSEAWLDPATDAYLGEIKQLKRNLAHRHLHPETEQAKQFDARLNEQIRQLNTRYPHLNL